MAWEFQANGADGRQRPQRARGQRHQPGRRQDPDPSGSSGERLRVQVGDQPAAVQTAVKEDFAKATGENVEDVSVNVVSPTWGSGTRRRGDRPGHAAPGGAPAGLEPARDPGPARDPTVPRSGCLCDLDRPVARRGPGGARGPVPGRTGRPQAGGHPHQEHLRELRLGLQPAHLGHPTHRRPVALTRPVRPELRRLLGPAAAALPLAGRVFAPRAAASTSRSGCPTANPSRPGPTRPTRGRRRCRAASTGPGCRAGTSGTSSPATTSPTPT